MVGTGIGLGLSGFRVNPPGVLATLDLNFASSLSLTSTSGITPSFSRASTGTYFNSAGVLTSAAINGPRFDHVYNGSSWVSKGLLVEEQRTNVALQSNNLNTSPWTQSNNTATEAAATSPDGTSNASGVVPNTTNAAHYTYQLVTTSAISYAISFYAKKNGYNFVQLSTGTTTDYVNFNLNTGSVGNVSGGIYSSAKIESVGNSWYRCSVNMAASAGSYDHGITVINADTASRRPAFAGDGASGILLYGFQMEAGSFSTSHIPTTTAAVTRSADVCQITGGDFSGFWNEPAGALVAEGDTPASGTKSLVSADNATANESTILRTLATDPLFIVTDGGVAQASIDAGTVASGTAFKLAAAYTVNDFAISKDGAAVVTDSSGTIPTPTQLNIGADVAGNYVCGHISRLRYYPTRLTNAKLQELST